LRLIIQVAIRACAPEEALIRLDDTINSGFVLGKGLFKELQAFLTQQGYGGELESRAQDWVQNAELNGQVGSPWISMLKEAVHEAHEMDGHQKESPGYGATM